MMLADSDMYWEWFKWISNKNQNKQADSTSAYMFLRNSFSAWSLTVMLLVVEYPNTTDAAYNPDTCKLF